ncbi:conserved hypothetical protein [Trichinella spiralis]|uniref:hypothetical protein n=1 Tax=Trichinella spiralis TaxID=6334 RepID=UPI0001EFD47B|nr:conserved hypothetical protein [Trichinella spiralis]
MDFLTFCAKGSAVLYQKALWTLIGATSFQTIARRYNPASDQLAVAYESALLWRLTLLWRRFKVPDILPACWFHIGWSGLFRQATSGFPCVLPLHPVRVHHQWTPLPLMMAHALRLLPHCFDFQVWLPQSQSSCPLFSIAAARGRSCRNF